MKNYLCKCGSTVYFNNSTCLHCGSTLAYDLKNDNILALHPISNGVFANDEGNHYRLCDNYTKHNVCNCITEDEHNLCVSCSLNSKIPNLDKQENKENWATLERAKRRLLRTLLQLNLSLSTLSFEFLEDQQSNPNVEEEFVFTGHKDGVITVNLREADDASRELTRKLMGELYRTPLGHMRHESGHFYFDRLVQNSSNIQAFREIFGDDQIEYDVAIQQYYANGPKKDDDNSFISNYAQAHPIEDWAECWAHYLHIIDTLETAFTYRIVDYRRSLSDFIHWIDDWSELAIILNELNRSMGLNDAYPFILSQTIIRKLNFVHSVIDPIFSPIPSEATG